MEEAAPFFDYARLGLIDARPVNWAELRGFAADDLSEADLVSAWTAFLTSCAAAAANTPVLRRGVAADAAFRKIQAEALALGPANAETVRAFIQSRFRAWRIIPSNSAKKGFLTGYYEPVVEGSWSKTPEFPEPLLARPADLVTLGPGEDRDGLPENLSGARKTRDGKLLPYPARREIDTRSGDAPLLYVRDAIEAFMIMVQGSATISVRGERAPLTYAGRNGRPYTSIGRVLIERGDIPQAEMSLARLKQWVRDAGQNVGQAGRDLLWQNESYVFFEIDGSAARKSGPIGGAGTPLQTLGSIAIDRSIWPYGLLFWIDAALPWRRADIEPFQRLMVAQDTGSAIIGSARADIYFGAGDEAGGLAGGIRHDADMYVLLPADDP